jgi:YbbR domain-containing protein
VTRLLRVIVHNWPLKLAAVGLATLLYGGLVVSSSTTTFDEAPIPVDPQNIRPDTFLLNTLDPVTEVRYFSPSGRRPVASTFTATVDLSTVPAGTGPVSVPVRLVSIDPDINVIGYSPDRVLVELDPVVEREVQVTVRFPPPPAGLTTGEVTISPDTVTVSGPKSKVDTVVAVQADVVIQPSGISVDQDVTPIAIDAADAQVSPVSLDPPAVHVQIPVFQDVRNKTLPVTPVVTGQPAPGFEVASVEVTPSVVTVAGDAEELGGLTSIETSPVSVNGASEDVTAQPALTMPDGVVPVDGTTVTVTVTLRPVTVTRTFEAGLDLVGEVAGTDYGLSVDRVILTLGGSAADLDRLSGATIVGLLDVSGLDPGTTDVPVTVDLPAGVTLVAASPPTVAVTVTAAPSPTPAAIATPSPSP